MSIIELKNVTKKFGSVTAVNRVDLTVDKGEIFGFLGPNGAGKTTTIRLLLDFIRPTSGEILLFGKSVKDNEGEIKSKIGYLSCENTSFAKWTGQEHFNFLENLRGHKSKILNDLVERLELNPKVVVRTLSSGNLQKLNFILALMFEPELLILDEPTKALDPLLQHEIFKILKELNQKGTTIFMSSHNLSEVESFCTQTGIIKQGALISTEGMRDLKDKQMFNVEIFSEDNFDTKIFKIPSVDSIEKLPSSIRLKVKGDINPVLQIISKHKIKDISIGKATLEEIFLEFYK
jgi:ABC-2 type transport system ATP-binding protein